MLSINIHQPKVNYSYARDIPVGNCFKHKNADSIYIMCQSFPDLTKYALKCLGDKTFYVLKMNQLIESKSWINLGPVEMNFE